MTTDESKPASSTWALLGLRIAALIVIILGGIILTQVSRIGTGAGFIVIGPRIFPVVVGIGLLILGLLFLLRTTVVPDDDLISEVTDAVKEEVREWQYRALGAARPSGVFRRFESRSAIKIQ